MIKLETRFPGVYILQPTVHGDERGYFMESYNQQTLRQLGISHSFVQDNESLSRKRGVIRGLHYQLEPMAQTKLVRVLQGAVWDVVVDLRRGSPTFRQWLGVLLSEENKRQLLVPKGFAHGICTLRENTRLLYKVDQYYSRDHDRGIAWNDPGLRIAWPVLQPVLSEKDRRQPVFEQAEMNFVYGVE